MSWQSVAIAIGVVLLIPMLLASILNVTFNKIPRYTPKIKRPRKSICSAHATQLRGVALLDSKNCYICAKNTLTQTNK